MSYLSPAGPFPDSCDIPNTKCGSTDVKEVLRGQSGPNPPRAPFCSTDRANPAVTAPALFRLEVFCPC